MPLSLRPAPFDHPAAKNYLNVNAIRNLSLAGTVVNWLVLRQINGSMDYEE
jgi:hypothetical protein